MSKSKKIDKAFQLTDDSVNSYGFRLLTSGWLRGEYEKNPIGYHMHLRGEGVVVRWEDIEVQGDKVTAKPVINMSHPRAAQTIDEIENGFLNAASVGHLVILEWTDDEAMKLPNQKGPTVTKWFNRECSLVDIGGNFNSLKLYDKDENEINLSDFTTPKFPTMTKIALSAAHLAAMNLKAEATDAEFTVALAHLVARASKADQLEAQLTAFKKQTNTAKVKSLLADALKAGKLTAEVSSALEKDYAENPEGLEVVLKAMPEYKSLQQHISGGSNISEQRVKDLVAKGYDDLMETGEIVELKAKAPEAYKQVYKDAFGHEPA